jgi:hypothetical protein
VAARSGKLWSNAPVTLARDAQVHGFARSAGTVTLGTNAQVTGGIQQNQPITPYKTSQWTVSLPASGSAVLVNQGQTRLLAPGAYAAVNVKTGGKLKMSAGTYFFDSLTLEPNSQWVVDDSAGAVVVYVRKDSIFRGILTGVPSTNTKIKLLVVNLGTISVPVEAAFRGTLFSPNATLLMHPIGSAQHWGTFIGKSVVVDPDVVVNHHAFPWTQIVPLPPGVIEMTDAPIVLRPSIGSAGVPVATATSPTPVPYEIPRDIWVNVGNAGNGTLQVSFRTPGGSTEVCTYTGGSPVANPTTDLDRAKGLRYTFPECTGNYESGSVVQVDWIEARILSADPGSHKTGVELSVGPGCSSSLPPPLTPEEVVVLRDGFNWLTVDSLPETDPDGNPALWHGLIYIDRREQLDALNLWRVYWSSTPFSQKYISQFSGKCGRMEHATEGKGLVVYAIFPAKLFNILRTFAHEALLLGGAEPPFKFIVPSTPDQPEYVNSDGSIKYSALATPDYLAWLAAGGTQLPWFGSSIVNWASEAVSDAGDWIDDNIIDPAGDVVDDGFSYVGSGWDEAVDWTANALDDGWELIQMGLGDLVGLFGEVTVTLNVQIQNRDAGFATNSLMLRGWGDAPFQPIVPRGAQARIRQWGWGFLPIMNQDEIKAGGLARIQAAEGQGDRGGALCIELENNDGMMTTDLAPNEVCKFDGLNFDNFEHNTTNDLRTNQKDLHAFTQIVDSADYARDVLGSNPRRAEVLIGWIPNELTGIVNDFPGAILNGNAERAMALCLDFPSGAQISITELSLLLGAAGPVVGALSALAAPIVMKDIWWPDENGAAQNIDSRGVMTHEFGHFFVCNEVFNYGGPSAMHALRSRLAEGANDSRSDVVTIAMEAMADVFAMGAVGGANYVNPPGVTRTNQMSFCSADPCMEQNFRGAGDYSDPTLDPARLEFFDELARYQSLFHDVFDRADSSARRTDAPWNGDVWTQSGGQLVESTNGYIAFADEPISLAADGFRRMIEWWQAGAEDDASIHAVVAGLTDMLIASNYNWCQLCELFALHTPGAPGVTGDPATDAPADWAARWARWSFCSTNAEITSRIGAAPETYMNVNQSCEVCPNLSRPVDGVCTPCGPGEVARGNRCEACVPPREPSQNNSCNIVPP